jgi:hypothetical protein
MNFNNKVIFIKKIHGKESKPLILGRMYEIGEYYASLNYYHVIDDKGKQILYHCDGFLTLTEAINETLSNDNSK